MTSQHKSALMRLGILSLLVALFGALFLAPISARSRTNHANLTSPLVTHHTGQDTTNEPSFLPTSMGLPEPTELKLTASDGTRFDDFGQSVSISGDVAVIGAPC